MVETAVCDFLTDWITTAEMRGGGKGALLPFPCFESGPWIRPRVEGACGWAVACRVGKVRRRLECGVHCNEASIGGGGERVRKVRRPLECAVHSNEASVRGGGESVGEEPRC